MDTRITTFTLLSCHAARGDMDGPTASLQLTMYDPTDVRLAQCRTTQRARAITAMKVPPPEPSERTTGRCRHRSPVHQGSIRTDEQNMRQTVLRDAIIMHVTHGEAIRRKELDAALASLI